MVQDLSRRAFVTASAGALAGVAVVALPALANAAPGSDAELFQMARNYEVASNYVDSLVSPSDEEFGAACRAFWEIRDAAIDIPAQNPEGIAAKARRRGGAGRWAIAAGPAPRGASVCDDVEEMA